MIVGTIFLFAIAVALAFWVGTCANGDDFNPEQPPEIIDPEDIKLELPPEDPGVVRRVTHTANPVRRRGTAPTTQAQDKAEEFVAAAQDTAASAPVLPDVKGRYSDGILSLAIGDSHGRTVREDSDCPEPCDFGTRDNRLFSESRRKGFQLLPDIGHCAAAAGAGAAIGAGIQYARDEDVLQGAYMGAGVGAGGCVIVKVAF